MRLNPLAKESSENPATISPTNPPQYRYNAGLALLFNRCFTATMSVCLLSLTAKYMSVEGEIDTGIPARLRYYMACTIISTLGTLYGLSISLPLLKDGKGDMGQSQAHLNTSRRRWTLLGIDVILMALWIAAAALGKGSAPHFYTKGVNLTDLGIVMALFESWAIGIVLFSKGFRKAVK